MMPCNLRMMVDMLLYSPYRFEKEEIPNGSKLHRMKTFPAFEGFSL